MTVTVSLGSLWIFGNGINLSGFKQNLGKVPQKKLLLRSNLIGINVRTADSSGSRINKIL